MYTQVSSSSNTTVSYTKDESKLSESNARLKYTVTQETNKNISILINDDWLC